MQNLPRPTFDKKAADDLNLTVLKRVDPQVAKVLAVAGHVALYTFKPDTTTWARKDVEGSLFLVQRRTQPVFQFIILNKKSQDNYVEDLTQEFDFEQSAPYILYRSKTEEVLGLWFYDPAENEMLADMLKQVVTQAGGHAHIAPAAPTLQPAAIAHPVQPAQPATAAQPPATAAPAQQQRQPSDVNTLNQLFSRAKFVQRSSAAVPAGIPPSESASAAGPAGSTPACKATPQPMAVASAGVERKELVTKSTRALVRQAIQQLSQSDAFIDMFVSEFKKVGLL